MTTQTILPGQVGPFREYTPANESRNEVRFGLTRKPFDMPILLGGKVAIVRVGINYDDNGATFVRDGKTRTGWGPREVAPSVHVQVRGIGKETYARKTVFTDDPTAAAPAEVAAVLANADQEPDAVIVWPHREGWDLDGGRIRDLWFKRDDTAETQKRSQKILIDGRSEAKESEKVLLVGPTGCGKTTRLLSIATWHEVTTIDDVDRLDREMTAASQRKVLSVLDTDATVVAAATSLDTVPDDLLARFDRVVHMQPTRAS